MVKRVLPLILCLFLLAGSFAGCGSKGSDVTEGTTKEATTQKATTQEATTEKAKEPVTITFWFPTETDATDVYYKGLGDEFKKLFPHITVENTVLPSTGADLDTKLNAALMSGTYPDVYLAYLAHMGNRAPRGEFAPLTDFADAWEDKDDIVENAYEMGKYNGVLYGMPFYPTPNMFIYRKDFFEEAGLDPEKFPRTWEELADYAVKLTKRDGDGNVIRAGLDIPAISPVVYVYPFMRQNGGGLKDENGNPTLNLPENIEALEFVIDLAINKKVNIPYAHNKRQEFPFVKGNSAMSLYLVVADVVNMVKNDPTMTEKLGFGLPLTRKKASNFCGQRLFTIGANSKYKDEAWEFIKFLMSSEQFKQRQDLFNIIPLRKSMQDDYVSSAATEFDKELCQCVVDHLEFGQGNVVAPWFSIQSSYHTIAYEEAYHGKKTPQQAYDDAQANTLKDIEASK